MKWRVLVLNDLGEFAQFGCGFFDTDLKAYEQANLFKKRL